MNAKHWKRVSLFLAMTLAFLTGAIVGESDVLLRIKHEQYVKLTTGAEYRCLPTGKRREI